MKASVFLVRNLTVISARAIGLLSVVLLLQVARGQSHNEVLVVYNSNYSDSYTVADHYMTSRNIPPGNLCAIAPLANDFMTLSDYTANVKIPIQACLTALGKKSILYIVMSYLTPYTVAAGPMNQAAVDSYLADIWDQYVSQPFYIVPSLTQPYYADSQSQGNSYTPFQSFAAYRAGARSILIYNVWRLDGPTEAIASALVDHAMQAEAQGGPSGQACIDRRFGDLTNLPDDAYLSGDWDLYQAAVFLQQAGVTVVEDTNGAEFGTAPAPLTCPDTAFYSGWYSYYNYNDAFTWQTGALGWHLDSVAAVNLRGGPAWVPNALLKGITVTTGPVGEPYLQGMVRPGGAFRNLLEGASVGDAFLRNTRWLKWQIVYIGDPLYKPFGTGRAPFSPLQPVNSLQLTPQEIVGGTNATGTITLASAAPAGGATFALTAQYFPVPPVVTVPGGATKASFAYTTLPVSQEIGPMIFATSGALTLQNTTILDPLLAAFVPALGTTMAGIPVGVTTILNGRAPVGGAVISLVSDNPAVIVPATYTVPAGSTVTTSLTANTIPVSSPVTANITGTYQGATAGFSITVVPAIAAFAASPSTINAGTSTTLQIQTGTVVPAGYSATIQLSSSDPASLPVPASTTIPAGASLGSVTATSSTGSSGKTVTITATYGGATMTTTVTIN